jgi:hypothetical protein
MERWITDPSPNSPLAEQRRIAAELSRKLAAAEALAGCLRDELAGIAALPGALLRRAFGGGPLHLAPGH